MGNDDCKQYGGFLAGFKTYKQSLRSLRFTPIMSGSKRSTKTPSKFKER